jgi:TonB family protein
MTALYEWLAAASVWWWPRFADHLWQSTVFALVILIASFAIRRGPALWRHAFCLIASAKFLVPATVFAFLTQRAGIQGLSFFRAIQQADQNSLLLITEPLSTLSSTYEVTVVATNSIGGAAGIYATLTALWLTGTVSILLHWVIRRRRFLRSLRLGESLCRGREWDALKRAQESLGMRSEIGLVISPRRIEPGVWRMWRPIIVLPGSMATLLDDSELEAIMLHELVHIQRRDNLIGNFQAALCALLWFHPLVWFISRKLFDEREQACDERVMEVCTAPETYASSILKVVRFCFGWRVAGVIGAGSGTNLRRRIENIMTIGNTKRRAGGASRLLASSLVGFALLFVLGAGIYSRPQTVSAVMRETGVGRTLSGSEQLAPAPWEAADKGSSKKTKKTPPPPPAEPAPPPASAVSAQPTQPPQPPPPPQQPESMEPAAQKDKESSKEKSEVKKGELIEAPKPVYPDEVKEKKIEGMVAVVITIGDDGNVIYAKAKSGPEELYAVSEAAALKARFQPTLVKGKPVKVSGIMTYNFELEKK